MTARWRPMRAADLPAVLAIADQVHTGYPEDAAVLAERQRLFPAGCWLLEGEGAAPWGYALSHPWHARRPPPLNTPLGALPEAPGCFYIHDVALLPAARGQGAAGRLMPLLRMAAGSLPGMALVAVHGSVPFWQRQGFRVVEAPELAAKLASYGQDARYMEN
ncbi:GNAT family N-acetyltransferase [Roseomonas sp. GC11]|uniref:GNAT family N-acetyltransferase n=1 Tax=Roseomonas sp. GC11 TaxID=2950546 RepID=UPI00210A7623|nr:GNAT family N-acetyltransferase [Roseomonas sp. GC11]MCQ4161332.1 GNAT family N-acetyltransferase [Roseomonas sp. GC11]